ncbi:MAG: asparagine synthase (glutamine-hydrolyzing) [Thermodesulfobacteriota bacterium]
MCGIVGLWNLTGEPIEPSQLDRFTDALAHRGPDGRGTYIDPAEGSLGLGHRRLAILDLSFSGRQPMSYAGGRYWITYNGEVYNFLELREELAGLGHRFASESDTEVILAAYDQWGPLCQLKFNGMWGLAVWDARLRTIFLSRDRFGVKPLHYYYDGRRFAFASEMKAFLALDWFRAEFDPQVTAAVLNDNVTIEPSEECLLQGLKRLQGGHCLLLAPGRPPVVKRWWNTLDHLVRVPRGLKRQADGFRELFFNACKIRMRSDVPLGTALSGGLDSSSVLCGMTALRARAKDEARLARDWQKVFVATFPGAVQDERRFAEEVVRHTGADPFYYVVTPEEMVAHLDEVIFQFEEIFDLASSAWLIYREMRRRGVVVSLDGHGGDELLAGYHHYPEIGWRDAAGFPPRPWRIKDLQTILKGMYPDHRNLSLPSVGQLVRKNCLDPLKLRLTSGQVEAPETSPVSAPPPFLRTPVQKLAWAETPAGPSPYLNFDALNRRLYDDFHHQVLPTILRNFDRCSMAHGVEIRAPFLDWRLVCYCFSLDSKAKIGRGFTKLVLRRAMKGLLPESIRTRTAKIGFASPADHWSEPPMKEFVLDTISGRPFLDSEIWDGPAVREIVEKAYAGNNHDGVRRFWPFIQAQRLMELFRERKAC